MDSLKVVIPLCMYQVYKYEMTIWETDSAPMQCVQRFNIIRHFIVPSTSVKRAKWFD